jgi:glucose 1-dehydrogenase
MSNPVCLVSGSSSGIGAAIVDQFARNGYDVVVNYNSGRERGEAVAAAIRKDHGVEALVIGADLSQPEAAFSLVDQSYEHFGRLDVSISNSGVANYIKDSDGNLMRHRFHETPIEHLEKEMERVLSLNLMGSYRLAQRSLKYMMQQAQSEKERGEDAHHRSILFITSISDIAPEATRIPYGVSKSGLNHAILGAALEGGPYNITVNGLRPGVVDTPHPRPRRWPRVHRGRNLRLDGRRGRTAHSPHRQPARHRLRRLYLCSYRFYDGATRRRRWWPDAGKRLC